jgi:molybdopterin-guanine dinucleotide biosynthesis protein A
MLGAVAVPGPRPGPGPAPGPGPGPGPAPIGVVLAGGAGRRLGGAKAAARLGGRSLAQWVAEALGGVVGEVVLAARTDTPLPPLGLPVWREPVDGPVHPLAGIASALGRAGGRDVLVCAVDLPFVDAPLLRGLLGAGGEIAVADGQPLVGRYGAAVGPALSAAAGSGAPVRRVVGSLGATVVAVPDAERTLFNVNTPEDLACAEGMLRRGDGC